MDLTEADIFDIAEEMREYLQELWDCTEEIMGVSYGDYSYIAERQKKELEGLECLINELQGEHP